MTIIETIKKRGFIGPYKLGWDSIPSKAGVYIILDNNNHVLDVGQSRNFSQRLTSSHEREECWRRYSNPPIIYVLYISSGEEKRKEIERGWRSYFESLYNRNIPCGKE